MVVIFVTNCSFSSVTNETVDDPIKEYLRDDGNDLTDTISSFMLGLFSGPETAKLFYTADLAVLLDVILRRLTDYGPGDKVLLPFVENENIKKKF